jgi:hypothetical protein
MHHFRWAIGNPLSNRYRLLRSGVLLHMTMQSGRMLCLDSRPRNATAARGSACVHIPVL